MNPAALELRRAVFDAFATDGAPPPVEDSPAVRELVERHVVVLDDAGAIVMAHPFAAPGGAARVEGRGRVWWGNCAWDGLGIVAALGLSDATVSSTGVEVEVRGGEPVGDALFHVAVPARHWWDDIVFT
jgi:Alkylmercury lyase